MYQHLAVIAIPIDTYTCDYTKLADNVIPSFSTIHASYIYQLYNLHFNTYIFIYYTHNLQLILRS